MADLDILSRLKLLKNSKISVGVDEVLPDILVVTFSFESKLFKGVLLDSTKRNLPCGVVGPTNFPNQLFSPKPENADDDKLFSVSQRFSYFQEKPPGGASATGKSILNHFQLRRSINPPARFRGAKMTVRLRPRQVLCSKCRSICNENSENVDHSAGRSKRTPPFSENQTSNLADKLCPTLIPKLARLKPNEINNAINGSKVVTTVVTNTNTKPTSLDVNYWLQHHEGGGGGGVGGSDEPRADDIGEEEDSDTKMVLRKKRSVGSMEDLWDESVFEEAGKRTRTTPVIKISFGSQGEGEVVKIPSKLQTCSESEAEEKQKAATASAKAAKRALKKAKKEARRKIGGGGGSKMGSPLHQMEASVLHFSRHRSRSRHKVKHKKKHKFELIKEEGEEGKVEGEHDEHLKEQVARVGRSVAEIKDRCLRQKLSISLRRLNATAYASASAATSGQTGCNQTGTGKQNCGSGSPATSYGSSSSCEEALPDFPPSPPPYHHPLPPTTSSHALASTHNSDGRLLTIGDIVWGKIHGFPWWPGKVLNITLKDEGSGSQAHVSWYGSSTSSLMPCDQLSPFLETFKSRFNKKKKSSQYKEAIRQATSEASSNNSSSTSVPSSNSVVSSTSVASTPADANAAMPVLTQLLSASPTQVHVLSY